MEQASPDTFEDLSARIIDLCGRMHGGMFQLLDLICRLDLLNPWKGSMPSCAHWLVWRCGFEMVTAREKVRVARKLADLPLIREKFRIGELSYSKVRAITRVAEPDTEQDWVEAGLGHTAAQLERLVRAYRQSGRLNEPGAALDAWKHRYFECRSQDDGSLVFEGRVPAEIGAMLQQALDRAMEWADAQGSQHDSAVSSSEGDACGCHAPSGCHAQHDSAESPRTISAAVETRPPLSTRRADALGVLAERFLAVAPEAEDGLQTADRYLLTIHAPVTALPLRARVDPTDPPALEHGAVLATETVRRIGCDAALVRVIESGDGEPLEVGRKTRVIPPAIRRALKRRDGLQIPKVNDRLQPGELDAEFGQGVAIRSSATVGADPGPAWRLARTRGFRRTGTRQRVEWEAFVGGLQR
ncbi:MAG: DUF222 domain-containing protein [Gammaproteobacteria bacterium]|nr:DUF222 domain-containing protein [Gammaproteobacteria bacterium]